MAKKLITTFSTMGLSMDQKLTKQAILMRGICKNNICEVQNVLIDFPDEIDIDKLDEEGWNPLQICAALNYKELLQVLLSFGASIDQKNINGYTALHIASACGNDKIVKLLLRKNANYELISRLDETAINVAKTKFIREIFYKHMKRKQLVPSSNSSHTSRSGSAQGSNITNFRFPEIGQNTSLETHTSSLEDHVTSFDSRKTSLDHEFGSVKTTNTWLEQNSSSEECSRRTSLKNENGNNRNIILQNEQNKLIDSEKVEQNKDLYNKAKIIFHQNTDSKTKSSIENVSSEQMSSSKNEQLNTIEANQNTQLEANENTQLVANINNQIAANQYTHLEANENTRLVANQNSQLESNQNSQLETNQNSQLAANQNTQLNKSDITNEENIYSTDRENNPLKQTENSTFDVNYDKKNFYTELKIKNEIYFDNNNKNDHNENNLNEENKVNTSLSREPSFKSQEKTTVIQLKTSLDNAYNLIHTRCDHDTNSCNIEDADISTNIILNESESKVEIFKNHRPTTCWKEKELKDVIGNLIRIIEESNSHELECEC